MKWAMILISLMLTTQYCNSQQKKAKQNDGFAVVELFTSEGCGSCPGVDQLMPLLQDRYKDRLYILSFHVDYWDNMGWKDGFSNSKYSERQDQYTTVFNQESSYTPEIVINGKTGIMDADADKIITNIGEALQQTSNMMISLSAKKEYNNVIVNYATTLQIGEAINIALVQLHALTNVNRGENSGKKLEHINIVRDLKVLSENKGKIMLEFPVELTAMDCKVIAYIQSKTDMSIHAATATVVQ